MPLGSPIAIVLPKTSTTPLKLFLTSPNFPVTDFPDRSTHFLYHTIMSNEEFIPRLASKIRIEKREFMPPTVVLNTIPSEQSNEAMAEHIESSPPKYEQKDYFVITFSISGYKNIQKLLEIFDLYNYKELASSIRRDWGHYLIPDHAMDQEQNMALTYEKNSTNLTFFQPTHEQRSQLDKSTTSDVLDETSSKKPFSSEESHIFNYCQIL